MAGRGKRYSEEKKLNYNKILGIAIFVLVIIMFVIGFKKIINTGIDSSGKINTLNYFSAYSNGKWGVINSKGETVIEPQYEEMIVIPDNTKAIFVCTYNVNYETDEYNTKVINDKNEEIISGYDEITFIDKLDDDGNIEYLSILKVEKDGKYGLTNLNGNEILPVEYDEIKLLSEVDNSILIEKDQKIGLCDYSGNIIIETKYKEIKAIGNDYKNGYITVDNGDLYGIIDFNKNVVFNNIYLDIEPIYSSNKYAVKIDKNYNIIDKNGKILTEEIFENVKDIENNIIIFSSNNKFGVMNISTETKIEPQYEDIEFINNNFYIAKKEGKYGVINQDNDIEIDFKYKSMTYLDDEGILVGKIEKENYDIFDSTMNMKMNVEYIENFDGYIKIKQNGEYKFFNYKFEEKTNKEIYTSNTIFPDKKNGKYAFIDNEGKNITEYKYDDVTEFNKYGYAGIKINGLWGVININGETVVEPKYEIEYNQENLNFIGKWHTGINSTYYTDV
jgi:hypothetical protein